MIRIIRVLCVHLTLGDGTRATPTPQVLLSPPQASFLAITCRLRHDMTYIISTIYYIYSLLFFKEFLKIQ